MANHKSSEKRARQTIAKTEHNKSRKNKVKTLVKQVRLALADKDAAKAKELLPKAQAEINKLVTAGISKKETASRRTARLASQVAKLK